MTNASVGASIGPNGRPGVPVDGAGDDAFKAGDAADLRVAREVRARRGTAVHCAGESSSVHGLLDDDAWRFGAYDVLCLMH